MQGLAALLPSDVWNRLLHAGHARSHPRGHVLMRQGDAGTHVLLVTAGEVKITRVERDGRDLLLAVRGPGEALGDFTAWDGSPRTSTAVTLDRCVTYVVSAQQFRKILIESGQRDVLLHHLTARLREGEDARADLADLSSTQRVMRVLLRLSGADSTARRPSDPLALRLSQEELAGATGLSRSAVAAALAHLRRTGLVTTGRQHILLLDVEALRNSVEPGSTADSPVADR